MSLKSRILYIIKKDVVCFTAVTLAIVSAFFVSPSKDYINYIDFRTLGLLLALMLVVQGFMRCGFFDVLVEKLTVKVNNRRQFLIVMILLNFFFGMLVTNDVALITFVPFSIIILSKTGDTKYNILVIVLETMAANMGSMLTPIGNPQNLYLYSLSGISLGNFILLMLPYCTLALLLLLVIACISKNKELVYNVSEKATINKLHFCYYIVLFGICMLTVLRVLDYRIMLAIVILSIALVDKTILLKADYILLITFIGFFIFIGNIKNIDEISSFLDSIISNRECLLSIGLSQFVSNVPAAMLLSGFTTNYNEIIIGVNLGGLGTIIASMASLISFKFYTKEEGSKPGSYLLCFLKYSAILLFFLLVLWFIL